MRSRIQRSNGKVSSTGNNVDWLVYYSGPLLPMTALRQRQPRQREPQYLAWLRLQGCSCGCKSPPPSDAAHLRAGSIVHDKPITGMGTKPDDRWALPLRHDHHMAQHRHGSELSWWSAHGIEPFSLTMWYYTSYLASRKPAESRPVSRPRKPKVCAKTRQRPRPRAPWPKKSRKIASRGFAKGRKLQKRGSHVRT